MIPLIILIVIVILAIIFFSKKKESRLNFKMPVNTKQLLSDNVAFYQTLDEDKKILFENRIQQFLQIVTITGVTTEVEDLDRILIASGAIIPIFAFPDWMYNNIDEVLLYKDNFNTEYSTDGSNRNILGMVGDGAMHRQMILSQPSVRTSFKNATDGHNTVIHEFVHLIDKADGEVDGIPEYLLARPYVMPWLNKIHETITQMKQSNHSDINLYGATNDAEFLAVIAEYFFERPEQLETKHPELYTLLEQMFTNTHTDK
jgi:Mlc titration factor MtfA (ptsG expression regulator)